MSRAPARVPAPRPIVYPDGDGQPMAENTLQFEWIVTIKEGIDALFRDDPAVFVAGDLFWYPVEGHPEIVTAPDALVAFGRPKGYRGSYRQWEEGGIAPQVVFEVLSPGNRLGEMARKFQFYERFGVEEYYIDDPDDNVLTGWRRDGEALEKVGPRAMRAWTSPRLGVRFDWTDDGLTLVRPDGRPFLTYQELDQARAEAERLAAEAEHRADAADHRAAEAERRAEALAERLRALGIDPEA